MIGAVPTLPALNRFKKMLDYKEYGGALFLGVKNQLLKLMEVVMKNYLNLL